MSDEYTAEISKLPGVGKASVEKLLAAGYTSKAKLLEASVEDLKEAGLTAKVAQAVHDGIRSAPAAKSEPAIKEVQELGKAEAEPETRIIEAREHVPRIKPQLDDETARALKLRNFQNRNHPVFRRQEAHVYKDLGDKWRKPRGYHSKQRKGWSSRTPLVRVGYRVIEAARGLHRSGFREVMVHNPADLEAIDPAVEAARIGRTVGKRKRATIVAAAAEKKIRVLNPGRGAQ